MSERPVVSVLMPIHNGGRYFPEAIDSVLGQTRGDFEVLAVNDHSTDGSAEVIDDRAARDARVRRLDAPGRGYTRALNFGLGHARGRYVARMDADDVCVAERFERQAAYLEAHPACVAVGSRTLLIDDRGRPIRSFSEALTHEEIDAAHLEGRGGAIVHPAAMMRREALERIGGYRVETEPAEDLDLFLRLAEVGRVANLEETLLRYRVHLKSVGHLRRKEQAESTRRVVAEARERRGLDACPDLEARRAGDDLTALAHRQKWVWWALADGHVGTARHHAMAALLQAPFSAASWKVFACALRGR
jgi:glycosyltransferase involved in cell wall biosynthesis